MNNRLLYLTGVPQVTGQGGKGYCLMGPNQVNPLNFEVNSYQIIVYIIEKIACFLFI